MQSIFITEATFQKQKINEMQLLWQCSDIRQLWLSMPRKTISEWYDRFTLSLNAHRPNIVYRRK